MRRVVPVEWQEIPHGTGLKRAGNKVASELLLYYTIIGDSLQKLLVKSAGILYNFL